MRNFNSLDRKGFRDYFQPSRVCVAVINSKNGSGINLITICFSMYCSYKPDMFAFSIQNCNHSYDLIKNTNECVIAIPGERLVEHTMYCGIQSGTRVDKFKECGLSFLKSSIISTPGLLEAKANIELKIVEKVLTGDHITVIGEVMNFNVDQHNSERNLVSVGAEHEGFELLLQKGIHRLAVPLRA